MDLLGPWHIIIIAVVFVAMFGSKRLPDAARSFGRSARIFKAELAQLQHDGETTDHAVASTPAAIAAPVEASIATAEPVAAVPHA